ncbi:transcription elongation factor GreA [Candidatus Uhrbacteria bacterium]|nr:transcription elongation factor GreA [Candidatus Uhrbacteria bacterium]
MRLPKRRSQTLKLHQDEGEILLTPEGLARLERELDRLNRDQRPKAVADVAEARQKGDLSENAEYQEARARLSRIQSRVFSLTERLKRVRVFERSATGTVALGSTVVVQRANARATYVIVGPFEADILRGRISHLSPLGSALIGKCAGDKAVVRSERGETTYRILDVW